MFQSIDTNYLFILSAIIVHSIIIDKTLCANLYEKFDQKYAEKLLSINNNNNNNENLPKFVDWRNVTNRVTTVKNEKKCNASWAFVTAGLLEGQMYRFNKGEVISLSPQHLIDCSMKNDGCIGGTIEEGINFVKENNGIQDYESYKFRAAEQICRFDKNKAHFNNKNNSTVKGFAYLPEGDINKLKEVLARYGPVGAYMDASQDDFKELTGLTDVYYNADCKKDKDSLNHAILVVGYGTHPTKGDYWIIKNSWSWAGWGSHGFLRISSKDNHCGIATKPVIAIF